MIQDEGQRQDETCMVWEGHRGYSVRIRGGAGSSGRRGRSEEGVRFLRARITVVWTWLERSR